MKRKPKANARQIFIKHLRNLSGVSEQYADAAFYTNDDNHYQPEEGARRYQNNHLSKSHTDET